MNKSLLLFIGLLATTYAVTFDTSVHCACEELNQTECTKMMGYCKWTSTCETVEYDFSCSSLPQANCSGKSTGYLCAWETSECVEKSYSCSDFTTADDCPRSIDCYWNKSGKCETFSTCADYDEQNCGRRYGCKFTSGACATFTCSSITSENECYGSETETESCAWTTDGKCQKLSETATCPDFGSFKNRCESSSSCKYATNSCSFKTCADYTSENQCRTVRTSENERTLCAWDGSKCADAADTSKLTTDTCFDTSSQNYRWTTEGKCEECSDLVSDDISSSVILSVFVALALIA